MMIIIINPFFWAFAGMFGLLVGVVLVLPFCLQPRFDIGIWNWIAGGVFLAAACLVRNPVYLCDLLFTTGFSVMFGSIIGLALIPVWWIAYLCIVLVEEKSLERAIGQPYLDYKRKVKGRILPGLPF